MHRAAAQPADWSFVTKAMLYLSGREKVLVNALVRPCVSPALRNNAGKSQDETGFEAIHVRNAPASVVRRRLDMSSPPAS